MLEVVWPVGPWVVEAVVCPISQLLKDTEKVNVILGNLLLAACQDSTVLSLKVSYNTKQGQSGQCSWV